MEMSKAVVVAGERRHLGFCLCPVNALRRRVSRPLTVWPAAEAPVKAACWGSAGADPCPHVIPIC